MINEKHLKNVLQHLTIPKDCDFVFIEFFVTEDKHYPGIKNIRIDAINQNVWFNIPYTDLLKIFNCEHKPLKMRALCNYLMANANVLDYRALDFQEGLRNRSNEFFVNKQTQCKNIRITCDTFDLEEKILVLLQLIEKKAEEYQFVIKDLSDLYL